MLPCTLHDNIIARRTYLIVCFNNTHSFDLEEDTESIRMVAIANKDEGLRCLAIAQRSLESDDVEKAKRFAEKAFRLYPGEESKRMLNSVEDALRRGQTTRPASSNSDRGTSSSYTTEAPKVNSRQRNTSQSGGSSTGTAEQKALVKSIRSKTCHYEVLSVSRTANDDDIKRSYRKLALKLHPDKNKAPGADEAFKMVSKAFSVLSSPDERAQYDRYGDVDSMPRTNFRGPRYTTATFNGQEIDPEEIFRMFFGGNPFMGASFSTGMPRAQHHRQRQHQSQRQEVNSLPLMRMLMSIAPMLLLLLFNVFSRSSPPAFSLTQNREYPFPSSTAAHRVPYFVASKSKFSREFRPGSQERTRLEYQIESSWKDMMQKKCYQEKLARHRFEYYGQPEKAAKVSLASCEALQEKFK